MTTFTPGQVKAFQEKRSRACANAIRQRNTARAQLKQAQAVLMNAIEGLEDVYVAEGKDNSTHYLAEAALQIKWALKQLDNANDSLITLDADKVSITDKSLLANNRASIRVRRST